MGCCWGVLEGEDRESRRSLWAGERTDEIDQTAAKQAHEDHVSHFDSSTNFALSCSSCYSMAPGIISRTLIPPNSFRNHRGEGKRLSPFILEPVIHRIPGLRIRECAASTFGEQLFQLLGLETVAVVNWIGQCWYQRLRSHGLETS